jgi:hypothetical protein
LHSGEAETGEGEACSGSAAPPGQSPGAHRRAELRRNDKEVVLNVRYAGRAPRCEGKRIALNRRSDSAPEMYSVVGDDDIDVVER